MALSCAAQHPTMVDVCSLPLGHDNDHQSEDATRPDTFLLWANVPERTHEELKAQIEYMAVVVADSNRRGDELLEQLSVQQHQTADQGESIVWLKEVVMNLSRGGNCDC